MCVCLSEEYIYNSLPYSVCLSLDVPGSGAYFMGYEMLLRFLTPEGERYV